MRTRLRTTHGFTLVEIVVALLISTMILAAAASVFVTTTRSWERGNRVQKVMQTARSVDDLLERYLRSALPPARKGDTVFLGEDLSNGSAAGQRITLYSTASGRLGGGVATGGASLVEFTFDPESGEGLKMRVNPSAEDFLDPGGYEVVLSEDVRSFKALYYNGSEWMDNWYDTGLPIAVEFHLTIGDPDEKPKSSSDDSKKSAAGESGESGATTSPAKSGASGNASGPANSTSGGTSSAADGEDAGPDGFKVSRLVTIPMGQALAAQNARGGGSKRKSSGSPGGGSRK